MEAKSAHFFSEKLGEFNHTSAIVPLISTDIKNRQTFFIGTAFYISSSGVLMTAKHNLYGKDNKLFTNLSVLHFLPNNSYMPRPIAKLTYSNDYDIAYLLPQGILDKDKKLVTNQCLKLTDFSPTFDDQLGMYGYPNSKSLQRSEGLEIHFNSEFYLGKCRDFHPTGFGLLKNPCFQTTINIKSGASGGPVFDSNGCVFAVCSTGFDLADDGENISFVTPIKNSFHLLLEDGQGTKMTIQQLIDLKVISFSHSQQKT